MQARKCKLLCTQLFELKCVSHSYQTITRSFRAFETQEPHESKILPACDRMMRNNMAVNRLKISGMKDILYHRVHWKVGHRKAQIPPRRLVARTSSSFPQIIIPHLLCHAEEDIKQREVFNITVPAVGGSQIGKCPQYLQIR